MRPPWITGRKLPPRPLLGIVFFSFEEQHVISQQDERVRAGTRAGDMTVVVDVSGRDQRRHVTAVKGALLRKVHLGPAALMADRVPPLMGLHPADWSDTDPAAVGVGVGHDPL